MLSETLLLEKLGCLRQVIQKLREEETIPSTYSYDRFCNDLDVNDVYIQRLLELLVKETADQTHNRHIAPNSSSSV